jgi:hypothetical protein
MVMSHATDAPRRSDLWVPLLAVVTATVAYRVGFHDRPDYAGHMLAGFGATLLALAFLAGVRPRLGSGLILAATLVAVAAGGVIEATVFRIAIFDPVDFAHQSLGGCLAGATVAGCDRRVPTSWYTLLGAAALLGGFWLAFS